MTKTGLGLAGKRAVVIGAGSGIGTESALLLAHSGADVVAADVDLGRAGAVAEAITALGRRAGAVAADVTDEPDAVRCIAEAAELLGGLDIVVNIVGFAAWSSIMDMTDETWALDHRRNLLQHLYVARAAAKRMIADGTPGAIAVVASVSGMYGAPNHSAYGAAKAGLIDLVRTMAQEWGEYGIRVNAVAPDQIATPRMRAAAEVDGRDLDLAAQDSGMPLGRAGLPDEIAGPLCFLVSDLASFMTGQTLVVDGGTMAAFPHMGSTRNMKRDQDRHDRTWR